MRTQVLRSHVTRNGGKLASGGDRVDFLCCDKSTSIDEMKKLWGESPGNLLVLNNAFISKSVVAQKKLDLQDFLIHGDLQHYSPVKKSSAWVLHACSHAMCRPYATQCDRARLIFPDAFGLN